MSDNELDKDLKDFNVDLTDDLDLGEEESFEKSNSFMNRLDELILANGGVDGFLDTYLERINKLEWDHSEGDLKKLLSIVKLESIYEYQLNTGKNVTGLLERKGVETKFVDTLVNTDKEVEELVAFLVSGKGVNEDTLVWLAQKNKGMVQSIIANVEMSNDKNSVVETIIANDLYEDLDLTGLSKEVILTILKREYQMVNHRTPEIIATLIETPNMDSDIMESVEDVLEVMHGSPDIDNDVIIDLTDYVQNYRYVPKQTKIAHESVPEPSFGEKGTLFNL